MSRDLTVQTPKALSTTIDSLTSVWADVGGAASLGEDLQLVYLCVYLGGSSGPPLLVPYLFMPLSAIKVYDFVSSFSVTCDFRSPILKDRRSWSFLCVPHRKALTCCTPRKANLQLVYTFEATFSTSAFACVGYHASFQGFLCIVLGKTTLKSSGFLFDQKNWEFLSSVEHFGVLYS